MKPWEETWEETEPGNDVLNGSSTEVFLHSGPRLSLAAAAPEMVRMLIASEWDGHEWDYGGSEAMCLWCTRKAPQSNQWLFIGPRERCAPRNHDPDCKLIAVLRKAGVIADKETR